METLPQKITDVKVVQLTKGWIAFVDAIDFDRVSQHTWQSSRSEKQVYAKTTIDGRGVYLHRFVLNAVMPNYVDHRNGNGLDCRRANLRLATNAQNVRNQRPKTGRFKGVSWDKKRQKWLAQIMADYRNYSLGHFDTPEEAARAYDSAAVEKHGSFAYLNFPRGAA